MNRNASCRSLVLRVRSAGESNREVRLLGEETGPIRATVFGGPKSRLRSQVSPFHSGTAWIYRDPVRDTNKLSDFDVENWRHGIREMYERAMAADAVADTLLASHSGGGNWAAAMEVAEAALDAIAESDEEGCGTVFLWFMWKWADFLGLKPDFSRCSVCSRPAPDAGALVVSPSEGGAVCRICRGEGRPANAGLVEIGSACRAWLESPAVLTPTALTRPDPKSFGEARTLATAVLAGALGRRLESWRW